MRYFILTLILFACQTEESIEPGIYFIVEDTSNVKLIQHFGTEDYLSLMPIPIITSQHFETVNVVKDVTGEFAIQVMLDSDGREKFRQASSVSKKCLGLHFSGSGHLKGHQVVQMGLPL